MTEQAITFADPLDLVLPALPAEADCATVLVSSDLFNYLAICLGKRAYRHPRSLEFTQAGVWIEVKVDRSREAPEALVDVGGAPRRARTRTSTGLSLPRFSKLLELPLRHCS